MPERGWLQYPEMQKHEEACRLHQSGTAQEQYVYPAALPLHGTLRNLLSQYRIRAGVSFSSGISANGRPQSAKGELVRAIRARVKPETPSETEDVQPRSLAGSML